jgi:hypothetical protein
LQRQPLNKRDLGDTRHHEQQAGPRIGSKILLTMTILNMTMTTLKDTTRDLCQEQPWQHHLGQRNTKIHRIITRKALLLR